MSRLGSWCPCLHQLPSAPSGVCAKPDSPGHSAPGRVFCLRINRVLGRGLLHLGVQPQAGLVLPLGTSGPQTVRGPQQSPWAPGLRVACLLWLQLPTRPWASGAPQWEHLYQRGTSTGFRVQLWMFALFVT